MTSRDLSMTKLILRLDEVAMGVFGVGDFKPEISFILDLTLDHPQVTR